MVSASAVVQYTESIHKCGRSHTVSLQTTFHLSLVSGIVGKYRALNSSEILAIPSISSFEAVYSAWNPSR